MVKQFERTRKTLLESRLEVDRFGDWHRRALSRRDSNRVLSSVQRDSVRRMRERLRNYRNILERGVPRGNPAMRVASGASQPVDGLVRHFDRPRRGVSANWSGRVAGVGAYSRNPGFYRRPGLQEYLPAPATQCSQTHRITAASRIGRGESVANSIRKHLI